MCTGLTGVGVTRLSARVFLKYLVMLFYREVCGPVCDIEVQFSKLGGFLSGLLFVIPERHVLEYNLGSFSVKLGSSSFQTVNFRNAYEFRSDMLY